jgi:hypothetical protein
MKELQKHKFIIGFYTALLISLLGGVNISFAEDFGQGLSGYKEGQSGVESELEDVEADTGLLLGGSENYVNDNYQDYPDNEAKAYLPQKENKNLNIPELTQRQKTMGENSYFEEDGKEEYYELNIKRLTRDLKNSSKTSFGFSYIRDNYSFSSKNDLYKRTYEDSSEGTRFGALHIYFENYLNSHDFRLSYGGGAGVGFSEGKAIFKDGTFSEKTIPLWYVPVDAYINLDIPSGRMFKLSILGGPSVLGLLQNRKDKSEGEARKRRRQIGFGFMAGARAKFDLTYFLPALGFKMFRDYEISRFFLTIDTRYQYYDNFQDNITVDGISYGLGFTYEQL